MILQNKINKNKFVKKNENILADSSDAWFACSEYCN